jgi:hypothetical protein
LYFYPSNNFSKNLLTDGIKHCVNDVNYKFIVEALKLRSEILDLKRADLIFGKNIGQQKW